MVTILPLYYCRTWTAAGVHSVISSSLCSSPPLLFKRKISCFNSSTESVRAWWLGIVLCKLPNEALYIIRTYRSNEARHHKRINCQSYYTMHLSLVQQQIKSTRQYNDDHHTMDIPEFQRPQCFTAAPRCFRDTHNEQRFAISTYGYSTIQPRAAQVTIPTPKQLRMHNIPVIQTMRRMSQRQLDS